MAARLPAVTPNAGVVDVILRDGRTLRLRPPRADDAQRLLDFFAGLSQQSLYQRFHGLPAVGPLELGNELPFLELAL